MAFAVMSLTEAAAARVREIVENAGSDALGIRVGIKKGGCAGMEYAIDLVTDAAVKGDLIERDGAKVWVAPKPCSICSVRRWISKSPPCARASPSTIRTRLRPAAAANPSS